MMTVAGNRVCLLGPLRHRPWDLVPCALSPLGRTRQPWARKKVVVLEIRIHIKDYASVAEDLWVSKDIYYYQQYFGI